MTRYVSDCVVHNQMRYYGEEMRRMARTLRVVDPIGVHGMDVRGRLGAGWC